MDSQVITLGISYWYCCRGPCYYVYYIPLSELDNTDIMLLSNETTNSSYDDWNTELFTCINDLIGRKYPYSYFSNIAFSNLNINDFDYYGFNYQGKKEYNQCTYRITRYLC